MNFATAEVERADGQTVAAHRQRTRDPERTFARNAGRIVAIDSLVRGVLGHVVRLRELAHGALSVACGEDRGRPVGAGFARHGARTGLLSWSSAASSWAAPSRYHLLETVAQGDRRASRASSPSSCCCSWRWRCSSWSSTSSLYAVIAYRESNSNFNDGTPASTTRAVDQALEQDADGSWTLGRTAWRRSASRGAWALVIGTGRRGGLVAGQAGGTSRPVQRERRGDGGAFMRAVADYPAFFWDRDDGLLVVGFPRRTSSWTMRRFTLPASTVRNFRCTCC